MKRGENKMKMNIRREWNWNDMKKRPSDCHAQINLQGFPPLALSIFISLSLFLWTKWGQYPEASYPETQAILLITEPD